MATPHRIYLRRTLTSAAIDLVDSFMRIPVHPTMFSHQRLITGRAFPCTASAALVFVLQRFKWHRWLGYIACKNVLEMTLLCVGWDVKPYAFTRWPHFPKWSILWTLNGSIPSIGAELSQILTFIWLFSRKDKNDSQTCSWYSWKKFGWPHFKGLDGSLVMTVEYRSHTLQ